MLVSPARPASERAALYRQLAVKLREVAMGDMDDQLRGNFLDLVRQYDARAANVWTPENPAHSRTRVADSS